MFSPRCQLCELTGKDLKQNEDHRKQLMMVLRDDSTVFSPRIKKQKALKKLEDKVALMEASWEEFCLLVKLFVDLHKKKTL